MRVSQAAFDLIVSEEVTSKAHYEAKLRHPEWPGGSSGVTVGIGYDLGQTDRETIAEDWRGRVSETMLSSMLSASGVTGNAAASLANSLKTSIDIPWDVAVAVHRERVMPRWEAMVERALPNCDRLSPDCFGALVSLTFNRGASFAKDGERYREMRAIKAHIAAAELTKIPAEIRAMKRLWEGQNLDGLLKRRDAEAELFLRGLTAAPLAEPRGREADLLAPELPAEPLPGPTPRPIVSDLAHRVIAAMERKGHSVDRGPGEINIVYVEGMNPDGTPNGDEANKWNDLRLVIRFEHGGPRIVGLWAATSEPGRYFTENPINPGQGAARIEFGQYKAWQVGMHRGNHESLVQTGGMVTVCRDLNKDGARTGDTRDTGHFGINQHWGYDLAEVDKASAGCLVGQSKTGHRAFMALVKSDPRYQADRKHVFATSILPESEVLAEGAVPPIEEPAGDAPKPGMDGDPRVRRLQKLLGFSEEEQDGIFGAITEEALKQFQRRHGLPVTGDADDKTWDTLEREAAGVFGVAPPSAKPAETGAKPVIPSERPLQPSLGLGAGSMNPLIAIAASVLPDIIKTIAGDKAGVVTGAVTKAVTDVTRTQNPAEASNKLAADPTAKAALQLKLAEIAAEQEEKRQQAQLDSRGGRVGERRARRRHSRAPVWFSAPPRARRSAPP